MADVLSAVSGLSPHQEFDALHQKHQPRTTSSPGDRLQRVLNFDTPLYNKRNRIKLDQLEIVAEELWVEFEIDAIAGTTAPRFIPTHQWVTDVQLQFKGVTVYNVSAAELAYDLYFNSLGNDDRNKRLALMNDIATRPLADAPRLYYLDLGPIYKKVLQYMGPMNAYASEVWAIDVGLRPLNQLVNGSNSDPPTGGTIQQMRLLVNGHRESQDVATEVAKKLQEDGVHVIFEQSNFTRAAVPNGTNITANISFAELQGEMTQVIHVMRDTSLLNSTDPATLNPLAWEIFDGPGDVYRLGTQALPVRVFGQDRPQRTIRLMQTGKAYNGAAEFVDVDGVNRKLGILSVSLEEKASMGANTGMYSGALRINNDFRAALVNVTASTGTGYTIDTLVMIRRLLTIRHTGVSVFDEA